MTKPMNFPGRIDQRRDRALGRLSRPAISLPEGKPGLTAEQRNRLADRLALKLNYQARDVRTKKVRGQSR